MRRLNRHLLQQTVITALCAAMTLPALVQAQAPAETPPPLTLAQALAWAQTHHPDLRGAQADVDTAAALSQQAAAWRNPQLSGQWEDPSRTTRTTTWQWSLPVELVGKRAARQQAAQAVVQQAQDQQRAVRAQVAAGVVQAFYTAVLAQERVRLSAALATLSQRARDVAARRVAAGKAPPVEVVRANVAHAQIQAMLSTAQSEQRIAAQGLTQAMGQAWPSAPAVPMALTWPRAEAPVCGEALQTLVNQTPALQQAQAALSQAQAQARSEGAKAIPDVALQWGQKRDGSTGRRQTLLGVSMDLPVFDRNQGGHLAALRQVDKAQALLERQRVQVASEIVTLQAQRAAVMAQIQASFEHLLPGARQAMEITVKGYEQGKFALLDVLDAQRTHVQMQRDALANVETAWRTHAQWLALLGTAPTDVDQTQTSTDTANKDCEP